MHEITACTFYTAKVEVGKRMLPFSLQNDTWLFTITHARTSGAHGEFRVRAKLTSSPCSRSARAPFSSAPFTLKVPQHVHYAEDSTARPTTETTG